MIGRTVWFVAGAGAGVYATMKARRAAEALTTDGLADRLAGLSLGLHLFGQEVRAGMTERETELRERLGLPLHGGGRAELTRGPGGLDHPAGRLDQQGLDRLDQPGVDHPNHEREGTD